MSRQSDETVTERADIVAPALPPASHDTPVTPPPRAGVPLPLVAHMVARLVGGQATAAGDIPVLVETVSAALEQILYPAAHRPEIEASEAAPALEARSRQPRRQREPARKPGRPRKVEAAEPVVAEAPAPPPAPRLVRRAEAVVTAPAPETVALAPPAASMVKGVVRWFDPARQSGGLRLTGVPEDVAVEPAVFIAAGVTRLFKGQEIEAQLDRGEGRARVTALRVPGGPMTTPTASGAIAALGGRRPRMVIVEKKRDGLKRVAARTEAEHLLGPAGAPKPQR
jgi:cold shock CspA family protein